MILNDENYYTADADKSYLSVSQYKQFVGTLGKPGCEFHAMERLAGRWKDEKTLPLMVGSYVDSYFEGSLDRFKAENPDCFTKGGELKAAYRQAEKMIDRVEKDEFFMQAMSGEKQVIMTGELFGARWKIKMDSYLPGQAIVDLKTVRAFRSFSLTNPADKYVRDYGYVKFYKYWGYDIQGAVYQEIVRQNTGERLPFYLAVISKADEPDYDVGQLTQTELDDALSLMEPQVERILAVKRGEEEPTRCGECDCCLHHRRLTGPMLAMDW